MLEHFLTYGGGFLFRVATIVVEASLYLLIGCLTAGAIRVWAHPRQVRDLFGAGRWSAPIRAWFVALMLLPVCALGVLPILEELRRARVARHALLTFAIAAPMLNPISLIAGISYLGPNLLGLLMLGSFAVAVGTGWLLGPGDAAADRDAAEVDAVEAASAGSGPSGTRRLLAVGLCAARAATGPALRDVTVGVAGAAALAAVLSPGELAASFFAADRGSTPRMLALAPLSYVTPDQVMTMIPEMVKFRQAPGAMFALVALGVGLTLGHASWGWRRYGWRTTARWLGTAAGLALATALMMDRAVAPVGTANADNDHLNVLANPFEGGITAQLLGFTLDRFVGGIDPLRWATLAAVLALVVAGGITRSRRGRGIVEAWLHPSPPDGTAAAGGPSGRPAGLLNRPVPLRFLAVLSGFGAAAVAVVGAYAYYPAPREVFEDMKIIRADFFGELGDRTLAAARHHLDLWERQTDKLRIGAAIRFHGLDAEAAGATDDLRRALRALRGDLDADRTDRVRSASFAIGQIQDRCRRAYRAAP